MRRKKKHAFKWPPEIVAIWKAAPKVTVCRKFCKAGLDKVAEHIRKDKCERCLAAYRQLDEESKLIAFLMRNRN